MMILILLTKMIACSVILYGYYWLFLRNKRFHHYNRFYLLAATGLSITVPFIRIPIFFEPHTITGQIVNKSIDIISVNRWEDEFPETSTSDFFSSLFTLQTALFFIYGIITLVLLYMLGRSLAYIRNLSKKYPYEYINALKFYNTTEPGTPFSFFRSIFWNKNVDLQSKEGHQIFRHELFHVKQQHTTDILFLEIVSIFFWINPVFFLIKKEVKAIHEFLADQHAITDNNQLDYAELLILQSISIKKSSISNYFFQNHIKRRIAMITQFNNKKYGYLSRLLILPLSALLFCTIALYAKKPDKHLSEKNMNKLPSKKSAKQITVLIDAGHGGTDAGAQNNGLREKDIALAIAGQMKHHASGYNLNIVMTRTEDVFPTLKERTEMAKSVKADLVISLHVATAIDMYQDNGFDIYVTNRNEQTVRQSKLLAQSIATQIGNLYTIGKIKQRKESGIWILDAAPCPAVLIECGYITSEKDVAFITNPENQERIAKNILQGIVDYRSDDRRNFADTIPTTKAVRDTIDKQLREAQSEQAAAQLRLLEVKLSDLQKKQKAIAEKQLETELVKQKFIEQRLVNMQREQEALMEKLKETDIKQRKVNEERVGEMQKLQQAFLNNQKEMQINLQKTKERPTVEMEKLQKDLLAKRTEYELSQRRVEEKLQQEKERTAFEMEKLQKDLPAKRKEFELNQRIAEEKLQQGVANFSNKQEELERKQGELQQVQAEIKEHQLLMQKNMEMELEQQRIQELKENQETSSPRINKKAVKTQSTQKPVREKQ